MTSDLLVRTLKLNGFEPNFVMNITDVGHLVSDADTGEDKLEKSAKREGKTAWEIAEFYTKAFLSDYKALNLTQPTVLAKATDHIQEQIDLILRLEEKGFTYVISDGVYFDTSKLADYGKMSTLDEIKQGARIEINEEKRNPRDFALWKFSHRQVSEGQNLTRDMEWESPWSPSGSEKVKGFPGWHIECSAMSMRYLGEMFDIHTGGVDHISIHHTNEIAQSEAATGKKFVNYWLHTAFMLVGGQKISKSLGNGYRLDDLEKAGFKSPDLRYLYLSAHYRQEMNFSWESLEAAKNALDRLRNTVSSWEAGTEGAAEFEEKFMAAMNDDLNTPRALAAMWDMLKANLPIEKKMHSLLKMDMVLGLDLKDSMGKQREETESIPDQVKKLVEERNQARAVRDFTTSDILRDKIRELGYIIQDDGKNVTIKKLTSS